MLAAAADTPTATIRDRRDLVVHVLIRSPAPGAMRLHVIDVTRMS